MKLGPVRDAMEQAILKVHHRSKVWAPAALYEALVLGVKNLDGKQFPVWFLNAGGQSYALGHLVWLKKVGILSTDGSKSKANGVLLGELGTKHYVQPLSKSVLQRLEQVQALDLPAMICQRRPSGPLWFVA